MLSSLRSPGVADGRLYDLSKAAESSTGRAVEALTAADDDDAAPAPADDDDDDAEPAIVVDDHDDAAPAVADDDGAGPAAKIPLPLEVLAERKEKAVG